MQLWRKGKVRLEDRTVTIDGKQYGILKYYDIKSSSKNPYDYDNENDMGLNQLFVGQDPHKYYDGNPDDENGIYHDECKIIPRLNSTFNWGLLGRKDEEDKNELLDDIPLNVPMPGWQWGIGYNILQGFYAYRQIKKYDEWGTELVKNVEQIDVLNGNNEIEHRYARVTYPDGSVKDIEILPITSGTTTVLPSLEYKEVLNTRTVRYHVKYGGKNGSYVTKTYTESYVPIQLYVKRFGEPTHIIDTTSDVNVIVKKVVGRIYVFPQGVTFFLGPPTFNDVKDQDVSIIELPHPEGVEEIPEDVRTGEFTTTNGYRQFRVLIDKETGRTLASKVIFIDYWDTIFELYVHEDQEVWQIVVAIVVLIITVILLAYFPPAGIAMGSLAHAILIMGAFIGGIGALSGNKYLQAVGAVMSLGASIYGGASALAGEAAAEVAVETAVAETAKTVTIQSMLQYAFTEMPLETFLALFQLYNTFAAQKIEPEKKEEEEKKPQVEFFVRAQDDIDEVMAITRQHDDILGLVRI
jgi:hypothetical protein